MKLVTFARAVAPYNAGDKRLVPDEMAERPLTEDTISTAEQWPPDAEHVPHKPRRPILSPKRSVGSTDTRATR